MRFERRGLPFKTPLGTGVGDEIEVKDFVDKWVQVEMTGVVATIALEGTIDGTNWTPIASGINADSFVEVPQTLLRIRTNITSYTSGTPRAALGCRNIRTE